MKIFAIVATDEKNAIGKENKIPWRMSNDLKNFKAITSGSYMVMGRKTFESLPGILPGRPHVVISRNVDYKVPEGVLLYKSLEEAFAELEKTQEKIFVIGGGEIYNLCLDKFDKIYLTLVETVIENPDAWFPALPLDKWDMIGYSYHDKDEKNEYNYSFREYQPNNK